MNTNYLVLVPQIVFISCSVVRLSVGARPQAKSVLYRTVLEDQPDYDHLPFRKKSLDEDRSAPVIFTVNFFAI